MAINTTATSGLDIAAYDLNVYKALRAMLFFNQVATVRPTNQNNPGVSVTFTFQNDMAIASTALDESTDVDPVTITDTPLTLTLAEYGSATQWTQKLAGTSMVAYDPIVSDQIARNAAISIDELASIQLRTGDNVQYSGAATGRTTVTPSDTLDGDDIRKAVARLKAANVTPFGGYYATFIHPDVTYDLQGDTGMTGWLQPANYSAPERRWSGEIGRFAGSTFIEATRSPVFADAGSSTTLTDVYATITTGMDALAKTWSTTGGWREAPIVVESPIVDRLKRFPGLGWKWFGQFGIFRQSAVWRTESASSIGDNS